MVSVQSSNVASPSPMKILGSELCTGTWQSIETHSTHIVTTYDWLSLVSKNYELEQTYSDLKEISIPPSTKHQLLYIVR